MARFDPSWLERVQLGVSERRYKREQRSPRILGVTTLEASLELCCLPKAFQLSCFASKRRERESKTKTSNRWRMMSQRLRIGSTKGSEVAKRDSAPYNEIKRNETKRNKIALLREKKKVFVSVRARARSVHRHVAYTCSGFAPSLSSSARSHG